MRETSAIARDRLAAVVGAIPSGRWISYGGLAYACGGTERHARTLNQRMMRDRITGAHRVLKADGTISAKALGAPDEVRRRLQAEGIEFMDGKAAPSARLHPADLVNERSPR